MGNTKAKPDLGASQMDVLQKVTQLSQTEIIEWHKRFLVTCSNYLCQRKISLIKPVS
jgi:Ca2+-binding EF-hand superfamily protein